MTEIATTKTLENGETVRLTGLTNRTFGIELELLFGSGPRPARGSRANERHVSPPIDGIIAALRAVGVECRYRGYTHETTGYWKLVTDASVSGNGASGIELVSPILKGEEGLKEIEKVCAALAPLHPRVNETCGFHVHHGASDLTIKEIRVLARLVNRFKPITDGLLPPSRRNAYFASGWSESELRRIETARSRNQVNTESSISRYKALNLASLSRHGTVEFRQHSGTFEAEKITNWIMLTQGLVEKALDGRGRKPAAGQVAPTGDGLNNLLRASGLRTCKPHGQMVNPAVEERVRKAAEFFRARAKKFGVIRLEERSEVRSRARARTLTAAERVAEVVANEPAAETRAPMTDGEAEAFTRGGG